MQTLLGRMVLIGFVGKKSGGIRTTAYRRLAGTVSRR